MIRSRRERAVEWGLALFQAFMPNIVRRHQFLMIRWAGGRAGSGVGGCGQGVSLRGGVLFFCALATRRPPCVLPKRLLPGKVAYPASCPALAPLRPLPVLAQVCLHLLLKPAGAL